VVTRHVRSTLPTARKADGTVGGPPPSAACCTYPFIDIDRAQNWRESRKRSRAARTWIEIVYAEVDGNIGYTPRALAPDDATIAASTVDGALVLRWDAISIRRVARLYKPPAG